MPTRISGLAVAIDPIKPRPYLYSFLLFLAGSTIMWVGNKLLLEYVFPWSLVALVVVGATAIFWGNKPAVVVLILSVVFSGIFLPDLRGAHFHINVLSRHTQMLRMPLFALCGGTVIWLTHQSRLIQERAEKRKSVVETLKLMTLPEDLPLLPGYEIASSYRPAIIDEGVGGDFYDFFVVKNALYGILIGDVVGKGKEAAISTAMLRYSVRSFASLQMEPSEILRCTSTLIDSQYVHFLTATLFFGLLDSSSGKLRYCSAGHEPPIVMIADGRFKSLDVGGPMFGIGSEAEYKDGAICLSKDDGLLLVTDGVTEARSGKGHFLGAEGLMKMLECIPNDLTARKMVQQLDFALSVYTEGKYRDDVAILLLKRVA